MEKLIHEEIDKTFKFLEKGLNAPISLRYKMNIPIVNALWHILTGETLDYDDPALADLIHKLDLMMTSVSTVGILNIMPFLKYVFPDATG